jgi:hypothetical protein
MAQGKRLFWYDVLGVIHDLSATDIGVICGPTIKYHVCLGMHSAYDTRRSHIDYPIMKAIAAAICLRCGTAVCKICRRDCKRLCRLLYCTFGA